MDLNPTYLIAALLLPGLLGSLAAIYLRPALLRLLADICGTGDRADFWTRMASLGLIIGPTGLTLMRAESWHGLVDPIEMTRALLSVSLNGVLVVLAILAFAMWRQVPRQSTSKPAGEGS